MIDRFLLESADAISESTNRRDRFRIDKEALVLLSDFDYPGNIRSLRNLVYELTSHVAGKESISIQLVELALTRLRSQIRDYGTTICELSKKSETLANHQPCVRPDKVLRSDEVDSFLHSIAREGDIVLPLELFCLDTKKRSSNGERTPNVAPSTQHVRQQAEHFKRLPRGLA